MSYVKLHGSLMASTIWNAPDTTRIMWITLLVMADRDGIVEGSVPGLAVQARVSLPDAVNALESFISPDIWSRTKENEGRRLEVIEGGWRILNYESYREKLSVEEMKENARLRASRYRDRKKKQLVTKSLQSVTQSRLVTETNAPSRNITLAEADTEEIRKSAGANAMYEPNIERFRTEWPEATTEIDVRNFLSQVLTAADEELFFRVLAANRTNNPKWRSGYPTNAGKYLTTKLWREMPKNAAAEPSGGAAVSESRLKQRSRDELKIISQLEMLSQHEIMQIVENKSPNWELAREVLAGTARYK